MYSKLSHVTMSSHDHGDIATDPPACGACPGGAGKSGTRSANETRKFLGNSIVWPAYTYRSPKLHLFCEPLEK
jgi:hypothetical protein